MSLVQDSYLTMGGCSNCAFPTFASYHWWPGYNASFFCPRGIPVKQWNVETWRDHYTLKILPWRKLHRRAQYRYTRNRTTTNNECTSVSPTTKVLLFHNYQQRKESLPALWGIPSKERGRGYKENSKWIILRSKVQQKAQFHSRITPLYIINLHCITKQPCS